MGEKISRGGAETQRRNEIFALSAPLRLCVMFCFLLAGCGANEVSGSGAKSDIKASAVVFILPDCPICNSYIPVLNRIHADFAPRGINVMLIHADPETTSEKARAHAREYNIQCPVAVDLEHTQVEKAGVSTAPEAAVFSPSGELLYRGRIDDQYAGLGKRRTVVTSHDLRDALDAILAGKPVREPRTEAVGCPIPK